MVLLHRKRIKPVAVRKRHGPVPDLDPSPLKRGGIHYIFNHFRWGAEQGRNVSCLINSNDDINDLRGRHERRGREFPGYL